ncbi:MFS transporter [Robbsia sp. Bb-Pol-6]|uniref:MFS transporter n=1 Tax=Robbsia betulipollinis TaxID=2981849 RepID=A0ABT3ZJT3_9BURK|nr:MFS transporter [Robbsia betulipollinis]MCY0386803.1 MFS transporter [Robbsia betulipollinis]
MSNLSSRIESWPFSTFHRRLLVIGGLGYTFDAMDAAVLAFILPVLRAVWHLTSVQTGVLGSGTYIGYFFGALLAGACGDLIGRRRVMMVALAIYSAASLASAMTHGWPTFLVSRIVAGFGTGAESAIIAPYLAEFVSRRYRGTFVGSLAGFFSFGFVAAALLGYLVVPATPQGWRIVLVLTALPVLMLLWWRRALPESPRWLESRGRHAEAAATVQRIEQQLLAAGAVLETPAPETGHATHAADAPAAMSLAANFKALWAGRQARVTAMTWTMWLAITFSYYSFFTWIPGLLIQHGMSITKSFGYSLVIYVAQIPGYFSAAWLNEKLGRQATIATYMVLGGVAALAMTMMRSNEAIMAAGICLSFFMNGTYAGVYAYTAEVFPTAIRTTGVGTASAVGRIGAIVSPILVGYIFPAFGFGGVFGITTAVLVAGALVVLVMGINTRGRSLENIAVQDLDA